MNRKRKFENVEEAAGSVRQRKRSPNSISTVTLSAFATAKIKAAHERNQLEPLEQDTDWGALRSPSAFERWKEVETSVAQKSVSRPKEIGRLKSEQQLKRELTTRERSSPQQHSEQHLELEDSRDSNLDLPSRYSARYAETKQAYPSQTTVQTTKFSTWTSTTPDVTLCENYSQRLRLTQGQTLTVLGQYRLQVLDGLVSIAGAFLTPESPIQDVCSTRICALPPLKCLSVAGAEIEISHVPSEKRVIRELERLSSHFRNILPAATSPRSFSLVIDDLQVELQEVAQALEIPSSWQQAINSLCDSGMPRRSIVQICGSAGAGRSTFAQLLANTWVSALHPRIKPSKQGWKKRPRAVAMLELDSCKSQNFLSGQVSLTVIRTPLLIPTFTDPVPAPGSHELVRAHAIGLNGHKENMTSFLEAVHDLLQCYSTLERKSEQHCDGPMKLPLIVKCPAWFQGSGIDLNIALTRLLKPSFLICLGEASARWTDGLQEAAGETKLRTIQSQSNINNRFVRTKAELREMQLLSYFHARDLMPLSHHRPFEVSYSTGRCDFAGIFVFSEVPAMYANMLSSLLNGSLVSMIAIADVSALDKTELLRGEGDGIPYFPNGPRGYTSPFPAGKSACIGVALIRGIDVGKQTMQILTPVPAKKIAEVGSTRLILAYGAFDCPGWAYTEDMEYRQWKKINEGKVSVIDQYKSSPWVEEAGDEARKFPGLAMQAWKTRRFQ